MAITAPIGRMIKPGGQAIRENEQGLKVRDLLCSEHVTSTTNEGKAEEEKKKNKNTDGGWNRINASMLYLVVETFCSSAANRKARLVGEGRGIDNMSKELVKSLHLPSFLL